MTKQYHKIHRRLPPIEDALLPSNYCEKFHRLLYWEESQHIKELDKRLDVHVTRKLIGTVLFQ